MTTSETAGLENDRSDYWAPTYRNAIRDAWREFTQGVLHEYWGLSDPCFDDERRWPKPLAWLMSPWRPIMWRFSRDNLERLFRPKKNERRRDHDNMCQYVFWFGWGDLSEERCAEVDALCAEFGSEHMPPRDWMVPSVAGAVGMGMGMTREEVAAIVAE